MKGKLGRKRQATQTFYSIPSSKREIRKQQLSLFETPLLLVGQKSLVVGLVSQVDGMTSMTTDAGKRRRGKEERREMVGWIEL